MTSNDVTVHAFSRDAFIDLVCRESIARGEDVPEQVKYLARYMERLGAKTIVQERHYIDRHYVDEYAFYYSRMLAPPPNSVRRLHFFAREFDEQQFGKQLERSLSSMLEREAVEKDLMAKVQGAAPSGYLGYCSIRPLSSVPIGRTVIPRLSDGDGGPRYIWATNEHVAHLGNLRLRVDGLAFQQQDAAVGACATAALWSALVRVARQDGIRAPTPAEISDAALRAPRGPGRSILPANTGLTIPQLYEATRAFGFTPEVISAFDRPEVFVLALHTYLLSGIPVVLALRGGGIGHAVTAVGFQMSGTEHPKLEASIPVRSSRVTKLYVHDDRLGPYARAFIEPFAHPDVGEGLLFEINFDGPAERWIVDSALAPVYPKLRLSVASLIALAEFKAGLIETMVGPTYAPRLRVDFRYERAGDYLVRLAGRVTNPAMAAQFVRNVALSRWCAVIRWYLSEDELLELLYDTTDIVRDVNAQSRELLRGIICLNAKYVPNVMTVASALNIPAA